MERGKKIPEGVVKMWHNEQFFSPWQIFPEQFIFSLEQPKISYKDETYCENSNLKVSKLSSWIGGKSDMIVAGRSKRNAENVT